MTIGIPKAMLYYRYNVLWETFFKELGCMVCISSETNKKILYDGINFSIDECCLPSKIFMGHVYSLIGKCDYILVPRFVNYGRENAVCVKFNALYDIILNTFENINENENIKLIDYNIEFTEGKKEQKGFLQMGKNLGFNKKDTQKAYIKAKNAQFNHDLNKAEIQEKLLNIKDKPKILVVSHPYNTYDRLIGYPVTEMIKEQGGIPVFADAVNKDQSVCLYKELSDTLYWLYSKELVGAIKSLEDKIDGIVLLTAFPCGPDSLVNELIIRKIKSKPVINIIIDELSGEAGIQTRIESFMDIIKEKSFSGKGVS